MMAPSARPALGSLVLSVHPRAPARRCQRKTRMGSGSTPPRRWLTKLVIISALVTTALGRLRTVMPVPSSWRRQAAVTAVSLASKRGVLAVTRTCHHRSQILPGRDSAAAELCHRIYSYLIVSELCLNRILITDSLQVHRRHHSGFKWDTVRLPDQQPIIARMPLHRNRLLCELQESGTSQLSCTLG